MIERIVVANSLPILCLFALLAPAPATAMKVEIDKGNYACAGDSMTITVTDNTLPLPPSISVVVEAFDGGAVLLDTETVTSFVQIPDPVDQIFESGPQPISDAGTPANEDGIVNVVAGGTVVVSYVSGGTFTDSATTCAIAPPSESIPAVSPSGLLALGVLLFGAMYFMLRRGRA